MKQLNYREIVNQRYKKYSSSTRYFENYKIAENKVEASFASIKIQVIYYTDEIVKVFIGEKDEKAINTNAIILNEMVESLEVEENDKELIIKGKKIITVIDKRTSRIQFENMNREIISSDYEPAFKSEDGKIFISKINDCFGYYGLGEKGGSLNKKGCYIENYNTDDPETDDDSVMYYKTIPFYVALKESMSYGILFDNSFRSYFDMGKEFEDRVFFGAVGGQIQYYFVLGDNIKDVVKNYGKLTGYMEMPPLWSLGYQQNRFSYNSQEEVMELIEKFEQKEIPLDVVYLDIDYMDGFRVMTFKEPEFDKAKELISNLKEKGIKTITILDPGVKVDENYGVYQRGVKGNHFTKKIDGEIFVGAVWPGDSAFPDFSNHKCREWWKGELKEFISHYDIDGIWNDMNEPCVFNNDFKTMEESCIHNSDFGVIEHSEFHNRYGLEMSRCSNEAQNELDENKREFSMTRATYAGGQRYSSVWTGDNMSLWSQMVMSIPMNCNLGLSGFSFVGNDVGGFGLDTTEELFIRWMELGTFLPIFRNHSNKYTRRQEVWSFGERAEEISKKAIELRYELMPYIYNQFYISHKEGIPVFRPLIMEYQSDMNVINMKEEFMFGDSMLIAPVLHEGERNKVVYLPNGNWYNYRTNEKYKGGKSYLLPCDLDEILIFIKEGSIIPTYEDKYRNMEEKPNKVTFKAYGDKCETTYYYDDGKTMEYKNGKYNLSKITANGKKANIDYINRGIEEESYDFIYI